jgi:RsiW-degrading membrane proteinase PrsW (M82 family)
MLLFLLFYLVVIPLSILLHEVGHAVGILLFTKRNAKVYLGPIIESNKETFKFYRIHFYIKWAYYGFCYYTDGNKNLTKKEAIPFALGGPLASLVIAVLAYFSLSYIEVDHIREFIYGIALLNFFNFILTIIPIRYPKWWGPFSGRPSDGYRVLYELRK